MKQYLNLINTILKSGNERTDRTGVGTKSIFGHQMRFNLTEGFPLVTTKKINIQAVISELLWFIEGSTDERRLAEIHYGDTRENLIGKRTIWTANADEQGKKLGFTNTDTIKELGKIYGHNWRNWQDLNGTSHDQLKEVIDTIKTNPDSRRILLSAWNVNDLSQMSLPPCHTLFQFYVNDNKLSCQLYQRSADTILGIPFNIASYSLLTMMIAQVCNLIPYEFIHTIGDAHIYLNQIETLKIQLDRNPLPLPYMKINPDIHDINNFKMSDFELLNYQHHPRIEYQFSI